MIVQNEFRTLFKYLKFSLCEAEKFYCEINYFIYELTSRLLRDKFFYLRVEFFRNYSDPLCNVENLRDGVIYKDDFNGLRDSLICAWKISDKLLYFNKINAIFVWLFELFCVSLCL